MSLVISDELVRASGLSEPEFFQMLVLTLYEKEKISLGKASKLLGITQLNFRALMAEHGLYVHYSVEDLHEEVASLKADNLL